MSRSVRHAWLLAAFLSLVAIEASAGGDGGVKAVRAARTYGWLPMAANRLVFWLGVEEPYVAELAPDCTDLLHTPIEGLTSHRRRLEVRSDALVTATGRCPILSLRRASSRELAEAGLRRADARPLPLLPVAVARKNR